MVEAIEEEQEKKRSQLQEDMMGRLQQAGADGLDGGDGKDPAKGGDPAAGDDDEEDA